MNERPSNTKSDRRKTVVLIAVGAVIGMFALFFAMANGSWIAVSIPSPPWETEPSLAAFEARLWAVMLVSFVTGAAFAAFAAAIMHREHQKKDSQYKARLKDLETEIANLSRLLKATADGRLFEGDKTDAKDTTGGHDER